ncbi:hypothetical protein MKX03_028000 [Papaver bracteatum]|nr:hypothetical protein MKX03_028000 [Papaver bracteatum]
MEDNNIVQPKIEKQERVYGLSESKFQAIVDKLRAGYKRIEDAKSQRRIQVLKVDNCKSHRTGYYKNRGKSSQERIEWKLRQLKVNRRVSRPKITRDVY